MQGRYYEVGALISRTEQSIQHTRELRERQRPDLAQAHAHAQRARAAHRARRARTCDAARSELAELAPQLSRRGARRSRARRELATAEQALQHWQARWEEFNRALGAAQQTTQVERARIEQLENQQRRLDAHAERLVGRARHALAQQEQEAQLKGLADQEALARSTERAARAGARRSARAHRDAARRAADGGGAPRGGARASASGCAPSSFRSRRCSRPRFSHGAEGTSQWLSTAGLGGRAARGRGA